MTPPLLGQLLAIRPLAERYERSLAQQCDLKKHKDTRNRLDISARNLLTPAAIDALVECVKVLERTTNFLESATNLLQAEGDTEDIAEAWQQIATAKSALAKLNNL